MKDLKLFFLIVIIFIIGALSGIALAEWQINDATSIEVPKQNTYNKAMIWSDTQTYFFDIKSYDTISNGFAFRYEIVTNEGYIYNVDSTNITLYREWC